MKCEKVVAHRVFQEEIMKASNDGIGFSQESRVLPGHFDRDKMRAIVVARWYSQTFSNELQK